VIHRGNFLAHRLCNLAGIEQATHGHSRGNGGKPPANIERFPQQEQRHNFRRVVQTAGEAHRSSAKKMREVDNLLRSEAEKITAVTIMSIFLAQGLLKKFSAKGIVPDHFAGSEYFLLAVAIGAGLTVILATLTGFPISTTHALTGAIIGCGFVAVGLEMNFSSLGRGFVLPLLLSPVLAMAVAGLLYVVFHGARVALGLKKEWCVCIDDEERIIAMPQPSSVLALRAVSLPSHLTVDEVENCRERSGESRNRGPRDCRSVTASPAAEERGDPFKVVVRAVGVGEKTRCQEKEDVNHRFAKVFGVSSNSRHRSTCCLLRSWRCSPGILSPLDGAGKFGSSRTVLLRSMEHRQSDRRTRKTRDRALFCTGCKSCRKPRGDVRAPGASKTVAAA